MNAAQMARVAKERNPGDFCAAKGCLFRIRTRDGFVPCPKHPTRAALAPETIDLMEVLVTSLREGQATAPVLTEDELRLIRAKVAGGSFDALDAGALLDMIDYLTDAYEQIVQRSAQEADRGQALVLAMEERLEAMRKNRDLHATEMRRLDAIRLFLDEDRERLRARLNAKDETIEETRAKLRRACQALAIKHNNPNCACEFCEELRTEHHDGYDIVNAALAARSLT